MQVQVGEGKVVPILRDYLLEVMEVALNENNGWSKIRSLFSLISYLYAGMMCFL